MRFVPPEMLQPFLYILLFSFATVHALPQVKLGRTAISGRDASDAVEFFGGKLIVSKCQMRCSMRWDRYPLC